MYKSLRSVTYYPCQGYRLLYSMVINHITCIDVKLTLATESWSLLFKRLYRNNAAGSMFLYEKNMKCSIVRHANGEVQDIASVFPFWLTSIAFDSNGLVMKYAMDVAIMLDTLGHDDRLGLEYLIPVKKNYTTTRRGQETNIK